MIRGLDLLLGKSLGYDLMENQNMPAYIYIYIETVYSR